MSDKRNTVKVKCVASEGALLPVYKTSGAAGADVCAFLKEDIVIHHGEYTLVPTGLFFEIPEGYEIQVRPRSGLAFKNGVTVLNTPGTIDSDYRGEVRVALTRDDGEYLHLLLRRILFRPSFFPRQSAVKAALAARGFMLKDE